jgi:hypothetical protein
MLGARRKKTRLPGKIPAVSSTTRFEGWRQNNESPAVDLAKDLFAGDNDPAQKIY